MNKVVLLGRMVKDAELRFSAGKGTPVARFTLAINRPFKKDETDFINCIAFNKAAELIAEHVGKGKQLAISGAIQTGSYEAKDGTKRYTTDVVVDSFDFIGNKNDSGQANTQSSNQFPEVPDYDGMDPINDGDIPF